MAFISCNLNSTYTKGGNVSDLALSKQTIENQ